MLKSQIARPAEYRSLKACSKSETTLCISFSERRLLRYSNNKFSTDDEAAAGCLGWW